MPFVGLVSTAADAFRSDRVMVPDARRDRVRLIHVDELTATDVQRIRAGETVVEATCCRRPMTYRAMHASRGRRVRHHFVHPRGPGERRCHGEGAHHLAVKYELYQAIKALPEELVDVDMEIRPEPELHGKDGVWRADVPSGCSAVLSGACTSRCSGAGSVT